MLRTRTILPVLLLTLALPAAAGEYSVCLTASNSISCIIEQAEFARQQNDLATASMAAVERVRAFQRARNAEIEVSIAAVNAVRQHELEIEQNALADASVVAVAAERQRQFVAHQNALATASMERVAATRKRELAFSLTQCRIGALHTPRCEAERVQRFARQQNVLATVSMERVNAERARAFAVARNVEIDASMAAVSRARQVALNTTHCTAGNEATPRCEAERSRELALALTHCKSETDASPRCATERDREFSLARNAEINSSIAAVERARSEARAAASEPTAAGRNVGMNAGLAAYGDTNNPPLETGAIGSSVLPTPGPTPASELRLQHRISDEPCSAAGTPFGPLHFDAGMTIDEQMKPDLDRLADLAQTCPGVRIEIHGYSDATGSAFSSRRIAQARAQTVTDYLVAVGVAPHRLAAIGHSTSDTQMPYAMGMTSGFNRRVEILVRDPGMQAAARRVMWDLAELLDPTYVPAVADLGP